MANASSGLVTQYLSTELTPTDLVNQLLGGGLSVSNVSFVGANCAAGSFSGGDTIIGFESGIILSSGDILGVVGPNTVEDWYVVNALPGDADLDKLIPGYHTEDATVLEFDFVPNTSVLSFDYVFGSEEYNEYVNDVYNDVFGFFVNGVNMALIPGTTMPVSINNVNNGNQSSYGTNASNPEYYRNNDLKNGGGSIDTQLDGLTVVLSLKANVNAGVTNHIKLAIADAGDPQYDSDVFIRAHSLTAAPSVAFSSATYSVAENGGTAAITVNLSSASVQTVTVGYATSDGNATAGSDYTATSGTLTFNPGNTTKTFNITTLDDSICEGPETVNMALTSPGNATLGSPSTAVLTINDNETPIEIYLKAGWNIVSVPVMPGNTSVGAVFPNVAAVYAWDPAGKKYMVPTTIESCRGYWVGVVADTTITVCGSCVTNCQLQY
jgi:hypothetical protein